MVENTKIVELNSNRLSFVSGGSCDAHLLTNCLGECDQLSLDNNNFTDDCRLLCYDDYCPDL